MATTPPIRPRLITLGQLALVDHEGRHLVSRDSAKLLAVLAYLAAAPGRCVTRDALVDLFWADSPAEKARSALRQALYRLREVLGDQMIPAGSGIDVCLEASLPTDRDAFLAALDAGDLEAGVAQYGGPFAPGVVSAGSADFEQWADHERTRLHDLFAGAAESIGRHALASGDPQRALSLAQRLIDADALNERAWRLLLEAQFAMGSRVHLAASIAELKRRAADNSIQLDPRTLRVVEALLVTPDATAISAAGTDLVTDLVGREREFARLYSAWNQVHRARRGAHLHIVGGAGMGKSRCLADFSLRLRTERARVVIVRTTPRQRSLPNSFLAALVAALAQLPGARGVSERSARLLVDLQPAVASHYANAAPLEIDDPLERRQARTEALNDLLGAVSDDAAVALLLDDAHWWDAASRDTVVDLIERSEARPVLFVTAARTGFEEPSTAITAAPIPLQTLDADQIATLILSLGESGDTAAIGRLAAALLPATEGVPLHVLEALRLGLDRHLLTLSASRWDFNQLAAFIASLRPGAMLADRIASLTTAQRDALLIAALIEKPVDQQLISAFGVDTPGAALIELERLGMLTARGERWVVAHDAIAQATMENESIETVQQAHAVIGRHVLAAARDDASIVEAIRHLIDGEECAEITEACARLIRQRRANGDRRTGAEILASQLGPVVDPAVMARTVASLPAPLRRRPPRGRAVWGVGAIAVAALLGLFWWRTAPRDIADARLGVFSGPEIRARETSFTVRANEWWQSQGPLPPTTTSAGFPGGDVDMVESPVASPDGRQWLVSRRVTGAMRPTELMLVDSNGVERPLAPAPGDEVQASWAPDGSAAVFATTRWSVATDATFSLGVVDIATRAVRQLLVGPDGDQLPRWSPDGTRIAFVRRPPELAPDELCWVTADGSRARCSETAGNLQRVIGWQDDERVVVSLGTGNESSIASVNLRNMQATKIANAGPGIAVLSNGGDWLACSCRFPGSPAQSQSINVVPIRQPERHRRLGGGIDATGRILFWYGEAPRPWLASIHIVVPGRPVPMDGSYRLSVRSTGSDGGLMDPPAAVLSWRSSDTAVVSVDSMTGYLTPHAIGSAWISVSAGGWRRDSVRVTTGAAVTSEFVSERWDSTWRGRWTLFGNPPLPEVLAKTAFGRALTPNGDGTYDNGAYLRDTLPASDGIGVEALVQSPVNRSKWQRIGLRLVTVEQYVMGMPTGPSCEFRNPAGEGWGSLHLMSMVSGNYPVPDNLAAGTPFRLRLQIFPDGTCGVAIDGRAWDRSSPHLRTDVPYSLVLLGQSVGTRMLIGPLTVWRGVRGGVDWDALLQRDTAGGPGGRKRP